MTVHPAAPAAGRPGVVPGLAGTGAARPGGALPAAYGRGAYVPAEYRAWLRARVDPLLERHGFGAVRVREAGGVPGDESVAFPEGSLPRRAGGAPETAVAAEPVQQTLL